MRSGLLAIFWWNGWVQQPWTKFYQCTNIRWYFRTRCTPVKIKQVFFWNNKKFTICVNLNDCLKHISLYAFTAISELSSNISIMSFMFLVSKLLYKSGFPSLNPFMSQSHRNAFLSDHLQNHISLTLCRNESLPLIK